MGASKGTDGQWVNEGQCEGVQKKYRKQSKTLINKLKTEKGSLHIRGVPVPEWTEQVTDLLTNCGRPRVTDKQLTVRKTTKRWRN